LFQPTSATKINHLACLSKQQVSFQLHTLADNVAQLAFAALRRAATQLLLTADCAAIDQYLLLSAGPTVANLPRSKQLTVPCLTEKTSPVNKSFQYHSNKFMTICIP